MLKNSIKTLLRTAGRNPGYSFINIAGLAAGPAVCLIIGMFVRSELSYDRFHDGADRIYSIVQDEVGGEGLAWSGPQMGLKLEEDFPQIESMIRLIDGGSGYGINALISYEDDARGEIKRFNEEGFLYADPGFFTFFTFPLIQGSADNVLNRPGTVVVTESTARKYFGNDNPLGKTLMLSNRYSLEVTGVAIDPPENSHLRFNFVASYRTFYANQGIPAGEVNSFWWPPTHTYTKLQPGASAAALNGQLSAFSHRHRDADDASRLTPQMQPLTEIWLGPNYRGQLVFQFTVSMVLLAGTAVVYQQLQYTNDARMGFDKEQVVMLSGYGLQDYETLRSELLARSEIVQVTTTSNQPGLSGSIYVWEAEGLPPEPNRQFPAQFVGEDFFEMLEADIVSGRSLRANDPADIGTSRLRTDQSLQAEIMENRAIVINETAARRMGWIPEEAIGKQMRFYITENNNIYQDYRGTVAGVVEDYHTATLHQSISPVAYMSGKSTGGGYFALSHVLVKLAPGSMQQAMQTMEQAWKEIVPDRPFEAAFLEASMENLYNKEIRMGKLIAAFTVLALLIACLGLFGLAALVLALITVSWQSVKAALMNPVNSLRSE